MDDKTQKELDEFLNDDSIEKMRELGEADDIEGMLKLMNEITQKTTDLIEKIQDDE